MKTLGEYGLARPPLADDLAEAIFDMLKDVEQIVHPTASQDSDDPKPGTQAYVDAVTSKGG